jgi:hypothetical protein
LLFVFVNGGERRDDVAQLEEAHVDVDAFLEGVPGGSCLLGSFGAGQVGEEEPRVGDARHGLVFLLVFDGFAIDVDGEDSM